MCILLQHLLCPATKLPSGINPIPELIGCDLAGVDVGLALHETLLEFLHFLGKLGPVLVLNPGRRGSVRL